MPKTKISEYSATANSNTDVASINIDEGCAPSGINNAIRAVMGHLKDFQQGTNGDPFNGPVNGTVGATTPSTGAFTSLTTTGTINLITVGRGAGAVSTNTAVGYQAQNATATLGSTTAVGYQAAYSNTGAEGLTYIGRWAGYSTTTGSNNTSVGVNSLFSNTTGANNVANGHSALFSNTTASNNTAVGYQAGYSNTTAGNSSMFGSVAGYSNTTGVVTAVGKGAGYSNTTGIGITAVGEDAGRGANTTNYSTYIGAASGYNTSQGANNTFVGFATGYNSTGSRNTFVGARNGTSGCGQYMTTGSANTIIGGFDGNQGGLDIRTASNYIVLSDGDGNPRGVFDNSGNLLVGTTSGITAQTGVASKHNISTSTGTAYGLTVSNVSTEAFGLAVKYTGASPNNGGSSFLWCADGGGTQRAAIYSNGGLANYSANNVNLSDQRVKKDIQNAGSYLAKICAIPVRTFLYKDQTDSLLNLGVIAQEVEAIAPELVDIQGFGDTTPDDGVPLKAIYQTDLQYALMKCIQEQQALITQLTARITALEGASA